MSVTGGLLLLPVPFAAGQVAGVAPSTHDLTHEGQSLKAVCAKCHNLQIVMDTPMSYDSWHDTVQAMVDRGASGTEEQLEDIMDYLHRTMTTIDVNTAGLDELQIVLNVPEITARAIITRRSTKKFTGVADLKAIPGVDVAAMDAKKRLIFFK